MCSWVSLGARTHCCSPNGWDEGRRSSIHVFSVEAMHVRMKDVSYESSAIYLQRFCEELHIPMHVLTTCFEESDCKPPCSSYSWNHRQQMLNLAQQLGCKYSVLFPTVERIREQLIREE